MFRPSDSLYENQNGRVAIAGDAIRAGTYFASIAQSPRTLSYDPPENLDWLKAFLQAVFMRNLQLENPFDFYGLMGQFSLETDRAQSTYLIRDGNPAGIGIWQSGVPSPWTGKLSPDDAAIVWLTELWFHTVPSWAVKPPAFAQRALVQLDKPHLEKVIALRDSVQWPEVRTWDDLRLFVPPSDYVWAADQSYGRKIAGRVMEIWPDIADAKRETTMALNMTKGLISLPPMIRDVIDVSRRDQSINCRGYDWLGFRPFPKGLVIHRSQAPSGGTNSGYFHDVCCPALTDLEVNNLTGQFRRFVDVPGNSPSGWANGRVSNPYGAGKAFVDRYGIDAVNRDVESLEILGWFVQPGVGGHEDPVTDACWETMAQWLASRAHDYGIPYTEFPRISWEDNREYVILHQMFTIGTGKVCPGQTVIDGMPALIERARRKMEKAQTGAVGPAPGQSKEIAPDGGFYPIGLDGGLLAIAFGTVKKAGRTYAFNPKGTVSRAWYRRGKARMSFPRLVDHFEDRATGREMYFFGDGAILWRPSKKEAIRWMGGA